MPLLSIQHHLIVYFASAMSCFFCFKIKFSQFFAKIVSGIYTFQTIFDPVKEIKAAESSTDSPPNLSKVYFAFPLTLFLLNLFDTLLQLLFSPFPYRSNPQLMFHQILPLGFRQHGDVVVALVLLMATSDYAIILWTPFTGGHFEMQAHLERDSTKKLHLQRMITMNGQRLPVQLAEKIFRTHQKATRLICVFWMTTTAEIYILFIWQLVVKFSLTVRNVLQMINVPVLFLFGGWCKILCLLVCYSIKKLIIFLLLT